VELLSGYPALVLGTVVGYLAARLGWRFIPIIATGVAVLIALAVSRALCPSTRASPGAGRSPRSCGWPSPQWTQARGRSGSASAPPCVRDWAAARTGRFARRAHDRCRTRSRRDNAPLARSADRPGCRNRALHRGRGHLADDVTGLSVLAHSPILGPGPPALPPAPAAGWTPVGCQWLRRPRCLGTRSLAVETTRSGSRWAWQRCHDPGSV